MPTFTEHSDVIAMLNGSQEADGDNRDAARESYLFIHKRDGQWEPYWWNLNEGKPRYTFDLTTPIVDQIAGEIEQADFAVSVNPSGGDATKDDAALLDGMIRNIENVSNATDTYNNAARLMVTGGLAGWQVKQKFVDDDSFDQDLVVEPIANFLDSVWFGPFKKSDASDMKWCFVLEAIPSTEYKERFPEGSEQSLSQSRLSDAYFHKDEQIIIGQIYYIEQEDRTLLLMRSGRVLESNDENQSILDELQASGDVVVQERNRPKSVVKSRLFDAGGWLNKEQETVFSQIPVIPCIANFSVFENKLIYHGAVEKLFDSQRVYNYSLSREIEEGALAPRAKYWMTQKQAAGYEDTLATMNTNSDPVQFFNTDMENPGPPQQNGGAQINPGLRTISEAMRGGIGQVASLFAANLGDNPGLQSGVAIQKLQDKGDTGTIKYFRALERAISRTGKILVDAIPKVYDTQRQVRVLKEDGAFELAILNETVIDQQTRQPVRMNDLSKGKYDVTCSAGPSFQNKQQETVSSIVEIAQVDPSVIQIGSDILFNNITAPGMDLVRDRKRKQLFDAGVIPEDQMTDEEKERMAIAAQQPQQPDAATILAQAEVEKAQADTNKVIVDAQVAERREAREDFKAQQMAQKEAAEMAQKEQTSNFQQVMEVQKMQMQQQAAIVDALNKQADTLNKLRDAIGVDTIVGPGNTEAYIEQAQIVQEAQSDS